MKIATGAQFKAARKKQRLTKTEVATLMRLKNPVMSGYRTVTNWEDGKTAIDGPHAAHMEALATGWRPDWWKGKSGDRAISQQADENVSPRPQDDDQPNPFSLRRHRRRRGAEAGEG